MKISQLLLRLSISLCAQATMKPLVPAATDGLSHGSLPVLTMISDAVEGVPLVSKIRALTSTLGRRASENRFVISIPVPGSIIGVRRCISEIQETTKPPSVSGATEGLR